MLVFAFLFALPAPALAQGAVTKGQFIDRFFLNPLTRSPQARDYVPAGAEKLPPAERYAAVVKRLGERGVTLFAGSKPEDPLSRAEHITLTYLLAGGEPGKPFAEQKAYLRARKIIDPNDIGFVKSFEGDITLTRAGETEAVKISGAEPVHFRDVEETALRAKVELQFDDGSVLSIGEDTAMTIDEMVYDPKSGRRSIGLSVTSGTIRIITSKNAHPDSKVEVKTPLLVAGIRGSDVIFRVDPQGRTQIINIEGVVTARPVQRGESRPPTKNEVQQGVKPAEKIQAAQAPEQAQSVTVNAGQTVEVIPGAAAAGPVQQTAPQQLEQAKQATQVANPAPLPQVTAAQIEQTRVVVQETVTEPAKETVLSKVETREAVVPKVVAEDKGKATEEVANEGSVGGRLSSVTTPVTAESAPVVLTASTGTALSNTFLGLSVSNQVNRFGELSAAQQDEIVRTMTVSQAEQLLLALKPSSPFTPSMSKSLRALWSAFERTRQDLELSLISRVTAVQAAELIPERTTRVVFFFTALPESLRSDSAVVGAVLGPQAAMLAPALSPASFSAFFGALSVSARSGMLAALAPGQAAALASGLTGSLLSSFVQGLPDSTKSAIETLLSDAQKIELGIPTPTSLTGLSGPAFIAAYSALSATDQAAAHPILTPAQAETLIATLSGAALTAFYNAITPAAQSAVLDNLTASQAQTLISGLTGAGLTVFYNGLSATVKTAVESTLTAAQRTELGLTTSLAGLSGAGLITAFNALSAADQAAALPTLTASQAETLIAGLSGPALLTFYAGLLPSVKAAVQGVLTDAQRTALGLGISLAGLSGAPLLDAAAALTPSQAGQVLPTLTSVQATEIRNCTQPACLGKAPNAWFTDNFIIIQNVNDQLIIADEGNHTASLITHGGLGALLRGNNTYTPAEVALAIKTALESEDARPNTYTVTYNSTTKKFTILNVHVPTVSVDVTLLFDNSGSTASKTLGFSTLPGAGDLLSGSSLTSLHPTDTLTSFGAGVATGLARELNTLALAGGTINNPMTTLDEQHILSTASAFSSVTSSSPINVAAQALRYIRPDAPAASGGINDAWGSLFKPSAYESDNGNNGTYQAEQLRPTAAGGTGSGLINVSSRVTALNNNGFLSYAVQVEEDIANAAALAIRGLDWGVPDNNTIGLASHFSRGRLDQLVLSQLDASTIRARDAQWQQEADARAGLVLRDTFGNRVRVQQYVYRPPSNADEVRMTSIALSSAGLNYTDLRVGFPADIVSAMTAAQIRGLPWNEIFTIVIGRDTGTSDGLTQGGCTDGQCRPASANPSSAPALRKMEIEFGNGAGEYVREGLQFSTNRGPFDLYDFGGNFLGNLNAQRVIQWRLETRKAGEQAKSWTNPDPINLHAGSTRDPNMDIGFFQFRAIPRQYLRQGGTLPAPGAGEPEYFVYVVNDNPDIKHIPVRLFVVGDSTTTLNTGLQTNTCGSAGNASCGGLRFDNIWSAFRANQPAGPQGLPTLNIGANVLQITAMPGSQAAPLISLPITTFQIPWTRMIWRGESDFPE